MSRVPSLHSDHPQPAVRVNMRANTRLTTDYSVSPQSERSSCELKKKHSRLSRLVSRPSTSSLVYVPTHHAHSSTLLHRSESNHPAQNQASPLTSQCNTQLHITDADLSFRASVNRKTSARLAASAEPPRPIQPEGSGARAARNMHVRTSPFRPKHFICRYVNNTDGSTLRPVS